MIDIIGLLFLLKLSNVSVVDKYSFTFGQRSNSILQTTTLIVLTNLLPIRSLPMLEIIQHTPHSSTAPFAPKGHPKKNNKSIIH